MENIPLEIEQKLENLPIIPFDMSEDFQKILFSDNYNDIFNFYKTNYLPDVLKAKPEIYQRVSLYLTLTNQAENFTEQTDQVLYRRPVPSIDDFLTNKFFMGYSNATLYDFWKIQLNQIFKEGSPIRKVIFSGCIGSGKSTVARKAFVYALYRILCLRYPRSVFNIDQDATIANVVISMTLKQVYETNILPFVKLMESMPCFQRVMSQRSFENFDLTNPNCPIPFVCEKSTGNIYFPDNIIITCGSNQGHFTGYNVVNSFCFTGDTKVYTDKGAITFKELTDRFNNGEKFKTIDKDGKKIDIINSKETAEVTETIKIWLNNTNYIECTPNHLFLIKNASKNDFNIKYIHGLPFKEAQYLTENDEIEDLTPTITKEELEELYIKQGFSLQMVAEHLNTSVSSIFRLCKRYNIHKEVIVVHRKKNAPFSNKKAFYSKVSKEQLYDLYITKNLSYKELTIHFNTGIESIKRALQRYNIKKPRKLLLANCKKTMLSKYSVEHYSKSKRFKEQIKQTHLKNCGYVSNFQSPEWKKRIKEQNIRKLNVENIMQLSITKQKVKQTKLKRYGNENYNNIELAQQTILKRYGVQSYSKTQEFKEKCAETCLKKYGETSNLKTKEFREQSKKTCLQKYGVEHAMQLESTRQKVFLSKKLNKTAVTSSFEEKIFALLTTKFSKVERQYSSKEYPFPCDFYIPELKLYIEYQGHFSHNTHAFNVNNNSDLQTIEKWKAKNKQSYEQAIRVWTVRDPLKREIARKNNLNWIEFFSMEQFMEWYNEN